MYYENIERYHLHVSIDLDMIDVNIFKISRKHASKTETMIVMLLYFTACTYK